MRSPSKLINRIIRRIDKFRRGLKYSLIAVRDGGFKQTNISILESSRKLHGKNVLITGGTKGIGLSIAQTCLNHGAKVIITGSSDESVSTALNSLNNINAFGIKWDLRDSENACLYLKKALKFLPGENLNCLINNAGINNPKDFLNVHPLDWDNIYQVNSKGTFFITQSFIKYWIGLDTPETKKIINISSQGGLVGATYPYRLTRWDILGLTEGLAIKYAPDNIIVNAIAPGAVNTRMIRNKSKNSTNSFYEDNPLGRIANPNEIAELALFLLTDLSNYITGDVIRCDGGYAIK